MKKLFDYIFLLFLLPSLIGYDAYAGIGEVGPPKQDIKTEKTQENQKIDQPGSGYGGIGKIGSPFIKPPVANKDVKPAEEKAQKEKQSKPVITKRMLRDAKIAYYRKYYKNILTVKMTRKQARKSGIRILWNAMPDPPEVFVERYIKKQALLQAKKAAEDEKKPKSIPGLKGTPGLGGR